MTRILNWLGGAGLASIIAAAREYLAYVEQQAANQAAQESYQALLAAVVECVSR